MVIFASDLCLALWAGRAEYGFPTKAHLRDKQKFAPFTKCLQIYKDAEKLGTRSEKEKTKRPQEKWRLFALPIFGQRRRCYLCALRRLANLV